jgi:hypothetical protein
MTPMNDYDGRICVESQNLAERESMGIAEGVGEKCGMLKLCLAARDRS